MDKQELINALDAISGLHQEFIDKYSSEVQAMLKRTDLLPEENLLLNDLIYITDKVADIKRIIHALHKPVSKEGILSKNQNGKICLDELPLELFTEIEVLNLNNSCVDRGWVRAIIYQCESGQYLAGLDKSIDVTGMKARIR